MRNFAVENDTRQNAGFLKHCIYEQRKYADRLRERMSLFRSKTGIKTALLNTFITTFGVADGRNASVVDSSITLDNLF